MLVYVRIVSASLPRTGFSRQNIYNASQPLSSCSYSAFVANLIKMTPYNYKFESYFPRTEVNVNLVINFVPPTG